MRTLFRYEQCSSHLREAQGSTYTVGALRHASDEVFKAPWTSNANFEVALSSTLLDGDRGVENLRSKLLIEGAAWLRATCESIDFTEMQG